MKKTKVIIPALGILLLSTAASVTGTVAWFSMNTHVSATGMQLTVKTENGLVISNEAAEKVWGETTVASHAGSGAVVLPTSTADAATWYHANSASAASHEASATPETLTGIAKNSDGFGAIGTGENAKFYYLQNNFYVKSAGAAYTAETFYVNTLEVGGNTNNLNLDKSLRVLVKIGSVIKVYAPFYSGSGTDVAASYTVGGAEGTSVAPISGSGDINSEFTTDLDLPAYSAATPVEINVFLYYEGEDVNCKSANIVGALDNLTLNIVFGTEAVA